MDGPTQRAAVALSAMFIPLKPELVVPIVVALLFGFAILSRDSYDSQLPVINKPGLGLWGRSESVKNFTLNADALFKEGFKKSKLNAFLLYTDDEPHIVLGPEYADEIKAHPDLSFRFYQRTLNLAGTPGLEPFHEGSREDGLNADMVRTRLNNQIENVTLPLNQTARAGLSELWQESPDWHAVSVRDTTARLIAKLSSRVFLGENLCDNAVLEDIVVNYTRSGISAVSALKRWPPFLRPIARRVVQEMHVARLSLQKARDLLRPEQERRAKAKADALSRDEEPPKYLDSLHWASEVATTAFDPVSLQLGLSLAAVHSTADLFGEALLRLCAHSEWIVPLREEVITVLRGSGMNKNAITKLHLMDSFIKEAQRLKPIQRLGLQRQATKTVVLKSGLKIRQNQMVAVIADSLRDPAIHDDPLQFDPERFTRWRNVKGKEHAAHLVSTNADSILFGLGKYACPGRFFAAHEIKITICHILLKYDLKMSNPTQDITPIPVGNWLFSPPDITIDVRRRVPEINIDALRA